MAATAPALARRTHTAEEVILAIRAGDGDTLDALLADDPSLAASRTPRGASAVLVAAFTLNPDEETFIKPSHNALLRELLRCKPPLDIHDAALAGDTARLAALVGDHPELANAPHVALGAMPLHLAAFADRTEAITLLLAKGATLDAPARNQFHNTPLVVAMLGDATRAAETLLKAGADIEAPEEGGLRALHLAVETGDTKLVELLLDHGARLDAKAEDGSTPLAFATKRGREGIVKLLRSRGAT